MSNCLLYTSWETISEWEITHVLTEQFQRQVQSHCRNHSISGMQNGFSCLDY